VALELAGNQTSRRYCSRVFRVTTILAAVENVDEKYATPVLDVAQDGPQNQRPTKSGLILALCTLFGVRLWDAEESIHCLLESFLCRRSLAQILDSFWVFLVSLFSQRSPHAASSNDYQHESKKDESRELNAATRGGHILNTRNTSTHEEKGESTIKKAFQLLWEFIVNEEHPDRRRGAELRPDLYSITMRGAARFELSGSIVSTSLRFGEARQRLNQVLVDVGYSVDEMEYPKIMPSAVGTWCPAPEPPI
jgi:hypothetical protein